MRFSMPTGLTDAEELAHTRKFTMGRLYAYLDRLARDTRVRWVEARSMREVGTTGILRTVIVCLDGASPSTHRHVWFDTNELRWRWDGRRRHRSRQERFEDRTWDEHRPIFS